MTQQHRVVVVESALLLTLLIAPAAQAAHPQTIFDAAKLQQLQAAQKTGGYAEMTTALEAAVGPQVGVSLTPSADPDPRLVANMLGAYAMTGMILNNTAYQTLAVQSLMAALTWSDWGFGEGDDLNRGHMIIAVSIAYDVLYGLLSASQRTQVATRLGTEAQMFSTDVASGIWWSTDYLQNHNWINTGALGVAGYALSGDDPRAAGWIQQAQANSTKIAAALNLIVDGSWHEGVGYQEYGWSMALPYWLAAAQQGADVSNTQQLRAYGQYRMAIQLPDQWRDYIATHGDWAGWAGAGTNEVLRYTAAKYQDQLAAEAATRWIAAGARSTIASDAFYLDLEMIAYDSTVPGLDPTTLPLEYYASDQQLAVVRSDWSTGALLLGVKSGDLGGVGNFTRLQTGGYPGGGLNIGHDHMDDGAFWLYGDNEWLLPECVGYNIGTSGGPLAFQSVFHNTLLFDGTGELGDDKVSDRGLSYSWFSQRQSKLSVVTDTTDYAFVQADGTHLYPSGDNVQSLLRTFVMARDGYVVLNDTVAMGASHKVDQVFHFMASASQSGSWLRGDSLNDRTLGIAVVSPAAFTATIGTQTADKLSKQFDLSGTEAMIQVHATAASATAQFLELLWPTRGSLWSQNPAVTALDGTRPQSGFSLSLTNATEDWVFSSAGAFQLTGQIGIARFGSDGSLQRLAMLGNGELNDQSGTRMLMQTAQPGAIEVSFVSNTQSVVSGANATGLRFYGPEMQQVTVRGEPAPFYLDGSMVVLGDLPPAPDAGGVVPQDAGEVVPQDAGEVVPPDAGEVVPPDAGGAPVDAGSAPVDAGVASVDGGAGAVDAGSSPVSTKTMVTRKIRAACGCNGATPDLSLMVIAAAFAVRAIRRRAVRR